MIKTLLTVAIIVTLLYSPVNIEVKAIGLGCLQQH